MTKCLQNNHIGWRETLEQIDEYMYLGQIIKLKEDHDSEMRRRVKIDWKMFGKNRDKLKRENTYLPMCIIPAMTYECKTCKLPKQTENLFRILQRSMFFYHSFISNVIIKKYLISNKCSQSLTDQDFSAPP